MKIYVAEHNGVLQDIKDEFEIVSFEEAEKVVLWNDVQPEARAIINYARALKKPTLVVQHGRKGTSKYYPPFNEEITADRLCVWGPKDKEVLTGYGRDASKIEVCGTTIFSHLIGRKEHEGTNVVFCPEHWDRPVSENRKVKNVLRRLKNVKITTKIIEAHDPKDFDNVVVSDRSDSSHLDVCASVLSTADVVVGVSESTFELLAQALDIPVVIMTDWEPKAFGGDMRYAEYRRVVSDGAHKTTLKDLNKTIMHALAHPQELREERRKICEEEGGIHLNAKENLVRAIGEV